MEAKEFLFRNKKISYKTYGNGPTIVLLHGFGEDASVWDNQLDALKDYHLIIPDLPGTGNSETIDDMSMEGMAEVVREIIAPSGSPGGGEVRPPHPEQHRDPKGGKTNTQPSLEIEPSKSLSSSSNNRNNENQHLQNKQVASTSEGCAAATPPLGDLGGRGAVLIGHSMGGYITLAFAEKYSHLLRGIGLFHSSPFADDDEKKQTRNKGISFIKSHGGFAFLKTAIPNLYSEITQKERPHLIEQQIEAARNFSTATLVSYYEAMMQRPDRTNVLQQTHLPVLMIAGKFDKAVPVEASLKATLLPQLSYIHVLESSGHMGMIEEAEESNRIIKQYLQSIENLT